MILVNIQCGKKKFSKEEGGGSGRRNKETFLVITDGGGRTGLVSKQGEQEPHNVGRNDCRYLELSPLFLDDFFTDINLTEADSTSPWFGLVGGKGRIRHKVAPDHADNHQKKDGGDLAICQGKTEHCHVPLAGIT